MATAVEDREEVPRLPDQLLLQAVAGPCEGQNLAKAGQVLSVGRTKASRVHVKDPAVSEKHAEFRWSGNAWTLRDLDSSNGTFINGTQLDSAGTPVTLKNGDLVLFGVESKVSVQVKPVLYDDLPLSTFIDAEVEVMEQALRAQAEQELSAADKRWQAAKQELLQAHLPEP